MLSTLLASCVFCALLNAVVIFIMSGIDFENVDGASMEAVCGDDDSCVCEEAFPQFTFACADDDGYVPQHACDMCKGYVWFDDKHGEHCSMSIEQYRALQRKEENDMLESLKHIWDDVDVSDGEKDERDEYRFRCLLSDEEEDGEEDAEEEKHEPEI